MADPQINLHNRLNALTQAPVVSEHSLYGPIHTLLQEYYTQANHWMIKPQAPVGNPFNPDQLPMRRDSYDRAILRGDIRDLIKPDFIICRYSQAATHDIANLVIEVSASTMRKIGAVVVDSSFIIWLLSTMAWAHSMVQQIFGASLSVETKSGGTRWSTIFLRCLMWGPLCWRVTFSVFGFRLARTQTTEHLIKLTHCFFLLYTSLDPYSVYKQHTIFKQWLLILCSYWSTIVYAWE